MKKRALKTRANYVPGKGRLIKAKSMTVQDDASTLLQILQRSALGQPLLGKSGVYTEDPKLDDPDGQEFNRMDLTEQQDVLAGIRAMTERLRGLEKEYRDLKKTEEAQNMKAPKQAKNEGEG